MLQKRYTVWRGLGDRKRRQGCRTVSDSNWAQGRRNLSTEPASYSWARASWTLRLLPEFWTLL